MTTMLIYIALGVLSYLLGAIPFGLLIARANGVDIRAVGSGNIGATNVFRALGKGWGILAFACDALKGYIPAGVLPLLAGTQCKYGGDTVLPLVCACLAIAGHNWPVYLRFKGGKGVATSVGALLGLTPAAAIVGLSTWAVVFLATRYVSLASIAAAFMVALSVWLFYARTGILVPFVITLLCALVVVRHKSNICRLMHGEENRFEFKKR